MSTQRISVETTIAAPLAEVWRAYTTPEDIGPPGQPGRARGRLKLPSR